jgi:hypothetical protein
LEADCIPTAPRWPDAILNEYRMLGQPFMGTVVDTPFNEEGRLVYREGDQMMMGCGVYPANMERDERVKPLIMDLAKPSWMNPREPFDVYLRWAIKVIGRSHTKLICDMWATENYRLTPEGIVCDSVEHGDRVVRARGGKVDSKAVLVHGCKDESLAKMVMGKQVLYQVPEGVGKSEHMAAVKAHLEAKGIPVTDLKESKSWKEIAKAAEQGTPLPELAERVPAHNDDDEFWGDESTPAPIPVTAPQPTTEYVPPVAKGLPEALKKKTEEPVVPPTVKITRADIHKAMDGKKMRVADLAKRLKVQAHDLIGTFPVNGFALLKAGWVQDTIPVTKD